MKDYFIELPTFTIKRREIFKEAVSGEEISKDLCVITPFRVNLSEVTRFSYANYTDESSLFYDYKTGEVFKQSNITAISLKSLDDNVTIWCYITYAEMCDIHDDYLKLIGLQSEVLSYYKKSLSD